MKTKRLFFLVMAICLASGVRAQFNDRADEIYYYVAEDLENVSSDFACFVFNFDGDRAAILNAYKNTTTFYGMYGPNTGTEITFESITKIKANIKNAPNYYEDKVETTDYNVDYNSSISNGSKIGYQYIRPINKTYNKIRFLFSSDRQRMTLTVDGGRERVYKKVDKNYFRSGRRKDVGDKLYE